eukprot:768557-Hanusia_phi.AAC.3
MAVGWDGRAAFAELGLSIAVSFCSPLLTRAWQHSRRPATQRLLSHTDTPGPAGRSDHPTLKRSTETFISPTTVNFRRVRKSWQAPARTGPGSVVESFRARGQIRWHCLYYQPVFISKSGAGNSGTTGEVLELSLAATTEEHQSADERCSTSITVPVTKTVSTTVADFCSARRTVQVTGTAGPGRGSGCQVGMVRGHRARSRAAGHAAFQVRNLERLIRPCDPPAQCGMAPWAGHQVAVGPVRYDRHGRVAAALPVVGHEYRSVRGRHSEVSVVLSLLRQCESFSTSPIVPELPAHDLIIKMRYKFPDDAKIQISNFFSKVQIDSLHFIFDTESFKLQSGTREGSYHNVGRPQGSKI